MLNHDKDAAYALCDGHTVLHLPWRNSTVLQRSHLTQIFWVSPSMETESFPTRSKPQAYREQSTDIQGTQFKAAKEHMGGWIMAGWKNEQQHKLSQEISGEFSVWESIRPCLVGVFLLFLFPIAPGYCQDTVTPDAYAGKAQQWLPRIHLISFTPSFTALSHSLIDASPFFPL